MKGSKIAWTDNTFNAWIGCEHKLETVDGRRIEDPACQNCYAEYLMDTRFHRVDWGPSGRRERTSASYWKDPYKWEKQSIRQGFPLKVFCASLADWLDEAVPIEWFADLMQVIQQTPHLTWQLLTKRPELWDSRLKLALQTLPNHPAHNFMGYWWHGRPPANVWVGATVTLQSLVDIRVPALLHIPAAIRFLSLEPLADGAIDLARYIGDWSCFCGWRGFDPPLWLSEDDDPEDDAARHQCPACGHLEWEGLGLTESLPEGQGLPVLDMVIVGGESDADKEARPFHLEWAEFTLEQCRWGKVAFFMKQAGASPYYQGKPYSISDRKGENLSDLPAHLQVQEFPDGPRYATEPVANPAHVKPAYS